MGLTASLFTATQAIAAQSKGLEIAGKNLANINNPAYARQRIILADRGSIKDANGQTLSMGVEARGVKQIRDQLLDRRLTREISLTEKWTATQDVLESAQAALGQSLTGTTDTTSVSDTSQSSRGISDAMSDFFNSFDGLAASPQDSAQKQVLLQKASILVDKINAADSRLAQVQTDVDDQTATDVISVNDMLDQVAHYNKLIATAENGNPGSAIDLRDQRQATVENLSKYFNLNTQEVPGSNGQIDLTVMDSGGSPVTLVTGVNVTGPIAFTGTTFTGGAGAVTLGFTAGSLQARVDARDGAVQDARDGLSALASQFTTSVNAAYSGNFFAAPPSTGLIQLDSTLNVSTLRATATGNSGANELALAVAGVATTKFSTASGDAIDGTPGMFFSGVVSGLGQSLASTSSRLEDQQLSQKAVGAMRDATSGVSQDEELADMMLYQRAFQASARFFTVVDSLMELVVTRLGVS
jgi:flagellar hook-associated protein 1 FlgK